MTGIVDEVFNPSIERARRYSDDPYYGEVNEKQARELEQLKEQLAQKIRKESFTEILSHGKRDLILVYDLLGDENE